MTLNHVYNRNLMYDFLEGFRSHCRKKDDQLAGHLLRPFLLEETKAAKDIGAWTELRRYCRRLVETDDLCGVLRFMYGVFLAADAFDLPAFHAALSAVPLPNGDDLASLCQAFYKFVYKSIMSELSEDFDEEVFDVDLYHEDYSAITDSNMIPLRSITTCMPAFLAQRLFGLSPKKSLEKEDVDFLVHAAVADRKKECRAKFDEIARKNAKTKSYDLKGDLIMPLLVAPKFSEFDYQLGIAGVLLPVFRSAELQGQNELCYYILQEYVWPLFAMTPWALENNVSVSQMARLVESYADAMFALVMKVDITPLLSDVDGFYSEKDLREELLNGNGKILQRGRERFASLGRFGLDMEKTLRGGRTLLRRTMQPYLYSHFLSLTPYILYSSGHKEEAAAFFADFYYEISPEDRRAFWVQIPLVRALLETEQIGTANVLYGCYAYEMDRAKREMEPMRKEFLEMTDFLLSSKEYILQAREYTFDTKRSWYDVLFEDGRLDAVIQQVQAICLADDLPSKELFSKLFRIIEAFSYPSGIRLPLLEIADQDRYDKLEHAISPRLREWGQGFVNRLPLYHLFFQSMKLYDLRKMVNMFAQDHIDALAGAQVQSTLNEIRIMKESLTAETEKEKEALLLRLDQVIHKLVYKLQPDQSRREVEHDILKLQEQFLKAYLPAEAGRDLLSVLPARMRDTVSDYLITSEVVYRNLSSRADKDKLDFSPALIPLTKAMEMILHHLYSSMRIQDHAGLDSYIRDSIFDRTGQKRPSLEFGPYILLLKDYRSVGKDRSGRGIFLNSNTRYAYSHFTQWGGNSILDISKLQRFIGIAVKVQTKNASRTETYSVNFTRDPAMNREILALGLQYIKDNYRNVVAHKDPVSMTSVSECKEMLLETQNLLWMILSIIR